jgi:nucleoside-diphosphate-sugar epimerase
MIRDALKNFYRDKEVLITGGLGFIGSTLAIELVAFGAKVTLIDSLVQDCGGNPFNIHGIEDKVKVNISDVRDKHSINKLVQGKSNIFNLAGTLSHVDSMNDPFTDLEINCVAQLSILEACRKHNPDVKLVFAGTRGQYGRPQYLPVDEKHPLSPTDINGINNNAGEGYHILYNNVYGIKATSLRLTNTYGPRHQMRHSRQGIINWFIRQMMDGEELKIYGDGKQIRDTNYVTDVVEAMLLAMMSEKTNGEVYNLGGTPIALVDLIKMMIQVYGKGEYKLLPFPPEYKKIEVGDYIADYSKFTQATGWKPQTTLENGLRLTRDFYEKNKKHYW